MRLSLSQLRLAVALFMALSGIVAVNVLFLQEPSSSSASARARSERVKLQADAERQRRLALAHNEARAPSSPSVTQSDPENKSHANDKVGRFAPSATKVSPRMLPESVDDMTPVGIARAVQKVLAERGYQPDVTDGAVSVVTRAAIMAYEHDHGLSLTADPSQALLRHMRGGSAPEPGPKPGKPGRMPHVDQLVGLVQRTLSAAGYFAGQLDGYFSKDLAAAISAYEIDIGLTPSGRISAPLVNWILHPSVRSGKETVRSRTR